MYQWREVRRASEQFLVDDALLETCTAASVELDKLYVAVDKYTDTPPVGELHMITLVDIKITPEGPPYSICTYPRDGVFTDKSHDSGWITIQGDYDV